MPVDTLTAAQRRFLETHLSVRLGETPPASGASLPEGLVAKRRFLVSRWSRVPAELKAEVDGLASAVKSKFPHEDAAALAKAVETRLTGLADRMRDDIAAGIDSAVQSGDHCYRDVATAVSRLRAEVAGDDLVQALRDTPLMKGQGVERAFLAALDEVESALVA